MTATHHPLHRRDSDLVDDVLTYIFANDNVNDRGIPWVDILDRFTDQDVTWRTVERVLYEAISFGLIYRNGSPPAGERPDRRTLRTTYLGRHYIAGTQPTPLGDPDAPH